MSLIEGLALCRLVAVAGGPGATPRPVRSADQPQTSWHQRVEPGDLKLRVMAPGWTGHGPALAPGAATTIR
jgi:hypothetical protein